MVSSLHRFSYTNWMVPVILSVDLPLRIYHVRPWSDLPHLAAFTHTKALPIHLVQRGWVSPLSDPHHELTETASLLALAHWLTFPLPADRSAVTEELIARAHAHVIDACSQGTCFTRPHAIPDPRQLEDPLPSFLALPWASEHPTDPTPPPDEPPPPLILRP